MGYRSEVAIRFSNEATEVVKIFYKLDKKLKSLLDDADDKDFEAGAFRWEWIKWYEGWPDVQAMQDFLNQIGDEHYGLIRIGEETDDIEHQGCPHDFDMYVSRRIEW